MTVEDLLQRRFVEYSGNQFQKLFYEIMRNFYECDFEMPQSYGNVGDYKCDGYLKSECAYYACYSPENPADDTKASAMITKIKSDLEGLQKNIDNKIWINQFDKFYFIINLKYNNTPPAPLLVEKQLLEKQLLEKYSRKIEICILTQYDLKLIFNKLNVQQQKLILEKIYICDPNIEFDGSIVASIIEHFTFKDTEKVETHNIMEFRKKISFNKLSKERSTELLYASYSITELENFLQSYGSNAADILQSLVLKLYENATKEFPNEPNLQYDYIINNIYQYNGLNNNAHLIKNTNAIIMSKFFENCSIFESVKE